MPIPKDYADIIKTLLDATREGRVRWQGKAGRVTFSVSVTGARFAIWAGTDEQTERPFVSFGLSNPKGQSLDTWFVDEGDADYELMRELHQGAKRHGLGIPQHLQSLGKALKGSNVIGEDVPNEDDDPGPD